MNKILKYLQLAKDYEITEIEREDGIAYRIEYDGCQKPYVFIYPDGQYEFCIDFDGWSGTTFDFQDILDLKNFCELLIKGEQDDD